jgi:predicted NUDIX family phosphoesterase
MLATVNVDFNSEIKNLMSTKLINDNKEILKNHLGNLYRILSKDNEAQKQRSDLLNHSKGTRKRKIQ